MTLASLVLGPIQLDRPEWLWLIPALVAGVLWLGRHTLSGLEGWTRWLAMGVRLVVVALLVVVLAEPSLRRKAEDVAVVAVLDASRSVPLGMQQQVDRFLEASMGEKRRGDRMGTITVAEDALVQALPSQLVGGVERVSVGGTAATDLASGVSLSLAVAPKDAATRMVLASDGNETAGSLMEAASAARAAGVPIDVLPIRYRYEEEVIVDRLIAPSTARQGQTINVKVAMTATAPARGMLYLSMSDEPVDLDPDDPSMGVPVELHAGRNIHSVQVYAGSSGAKRFEARFEPLVAGGRPQGDSLIENNRALAVTFVSGEGKVLVVREQPAESEALVRELRAAGINLIEITSEEAPGDLTELASFDAIVLANQAAWNFSEQQQENLRRYVHDAGGGLIMIGGPDSYGAGGWIGSPLADALPVRLDPPTKRQMPRGALVMVMHSIEMPQGVYYGKQVANAGVDALSRFDLAGIVEFNPMVGRGAAWVHELSPVGDRTAIKKSINRLAFGDMPSFNPSLQLALDGLKAADAGQKHMIVISDGDPTLSRALVQEIADAGITISTVGVNPHSRGDLATLKYMADTTGGRFWDVGNQYDEVVKIFVKEAQIIRRTLIWEGYPITPAVVPSGSDPMRDIRGVPPITGYVVTADRQGLSMVTLRVGDENDPVAAHWQYGLGRVVAFTSDASSRWASAWTAWPGYRQYWEQHMRWTMRPSGSANIRIVTTEEGDRTQVTIEALDSDGERLPTGIFEGRVSRPDGAAHDVALRQTGPGRWEGRFGSGDAGTYLFSTRFAAPGPGGGPEIRGSAQAAVSKPFAGEFRALEDNSALLVQVAEMTGGRVLDPSQPAAVNLWRREGLTMPVATRSIWLLLALIGVGLFLLDVAVRRVRIEPAAIAAFFVRALQTKEEKQGTQVDALRTARQTARGRFGDEATREVAKRKFEASEEQLQRAARAPTALAGEEERLPEQSRRRPRPKAEAAENGDGMSRLMAAKRRAREDFEEEEK